MEITDVRVFPASKNGATKAYATITFDESFVVRDIRVVDGKNGLFISMPSRRDQNGEFRDIAHPITTDMRSNIQEKILKAFAEAG